MKDTNSDKKKRKLKDQDDWKISLPRWLLVSKLTAKEKVFCMILVHHRNSHTKLCCPSIPLLCSEAHLSEHTIENIRKKLDKLGVISWQKGTGQKHHAKYKLNWLDSSNEEIKKLKSILGVKKVGQKLPHFRGAKFGGVSGAKFGGVNNKQSNNKRIKQQQDEFADADFLILLHKETLKTLREYGISDQKIDHLIGKAPTNDPEKYFARCIKYIESPKTKHITNPAGFIISLIEKGQPAPHIEERLIPPYLKRIDKDFTEEEQDQEKKQEEKPYIPPSKEKRNEYMKKVRKKLSDKKDK